MEISDGRQYFGVGLDLAQLRSGAAEARNLLHGIGQQAETEGQTMDAVFNRIRNTVAGVFAVSQIKDFIGQVINVRGEIQSMEVAFQTLLGNKEKADAMFGEIRKFAVTTPMMMGDLAKGAQQMLAFGIEADKVMPYLRALGDVSMGDSQKFQSLTLAFSQMSATGKLMGQDLLQMINAGFNPLQVISEKTGKSIGELKDEMSKGAISADMVAQAFIDATSEGGKFHNMLQNMSGGVEGQMSNLQGAVEDMMNDLGTKMQGIVSTATTAATYLVQNYEPILAILGTLIASYGAYRAALMVNVAVESVIAKASADRIALLEAEFAAIGDKTATEVLSTDAEIAAAVAKGNLTEAEGLQILAMKKEAAARVEALALTAKQAALDAAEATAARKAAGVRLQAAEANAAAMRMEYEAALAKGEVFEIALAKERMETAQTEINTASQQYQAAATAETTAAKAAQTAQTTANTAAQQLNNVQVTAGTAATGFFASAVQLLNKSLQGLWATMMKHPIAALLAAVVALGIAIYNMTKNTKEANVQQDIMDEVSGKVSASVQEEKTKIEALSEALHNNENAIDKRQEALAELRRIVPDYHAELTAEGKLLNDNTDALERYIAAMMKAAKVQALKSGVSDTFEQLTSLAMQVKKKGQDLPWLLKILSSDGYEDKNRSNWDEWYSDFLKDPTKYAKRQDGKFMLKVGGGVAAQYVHAGMGEDWINDETRQLIQMAEQYVEYYNLYKDALNEQYQSTQGGGGGNSNDESNQPYTALVRQKRADLASAQQELARLEEDTSASLAQVNAARERVSNAEKALRELGVNPNPTGGRGGSGTSSPDPDQMQARILSTRRGIENYSTEVSGAWRTAEFAIEQARIDAMEEGLEKTLAQNDLNFKMLEAQNKERANQMVERLRDAMQQQWELSNPNATETQKEQHKNTLRTTITPESLNANKGNMSALFTGEMAQFKGDAEQIVATINAYSNLATQAYTQANEQALETALQDVRTYTQRRLQIEQDFKAQEEALYKGKRNADGVYEYELDGNGNRQFRNGVSEGNIAELQRQREEALHSVDEEFAGREDEFQAWCNAIGTLSLQQLEAVLEDAKRKLQELEASGNASEKDLAVARAKVNTATKAVGKAKADNNVSPGKRTIKEWEDLYKTLNDVRGSFEEIGDTVGGVVGDIISECGKMAASTLSMINGIVQLVNMSKTGIEGTAEAGEVAISTMEKASVILTIISAAMQIAMQIVNLFNNDDKKQEEIEKLQERIDQLQWELDNAELMRSRKFAEEGSYLKQLQKILAETRMEIYKNVSATGNWWQAISVLYGRATKNSELLSKTVDKLAKAYGNMSYTADKALGAAKYEEANAQLRNIAEQQINIQEQIDQERSKKKTDNNAITEYQRKIEELGQQALEIINDLMEDIIGDSSTGIANELADAFFEAFEAGEDAAEAWGDKVNEIVGDILKRLMVTKYLEKPLGDIFDKYKAKWFPDGEFAGLDVVQNSMGEFANELNGTISYFNQMMAELPDELKQYFMGKIEEDRDASQGGIATASQESVDELNGRATAIQGHTYSISENTKLLVANTTELLASVMNIEGHTGSMAQEMGVMRADLRDVRDTLSDIQMRGIRLNN